MLSGEMVEETHFSSGRAFLTFSVNKKIKGRDLTGPDPHPNTRLLLSASDSLHSDQLLQGHVAFSDVTGPLEYDNGNNRSIFLPAPAPLVRAAGRGNYSTGLVGGRCLLTTY